MSTLEKFKQAKVPLDKHEKVTYQLLNRDLKGRQVIHDAEQRVGMKIERQRQQMILERLEFEKQIEKFN